MRSRSVRGNVTAFMIAAVIFIMIVAFFVLNFTGIFLTQKKAQSAVDAAALEAAKQIGAVVVTFPTVGKVALVDQPPDATGNPIRGINTALATARLDCLIGSDLGNTTITNNAKQDLIELAGFSSQFQSSIAPLIASGGAVYTAVQTAYTQNLPPNKQLAAGSLKITMGRLSSGSDVLTNIPVPSTDGNHPDPEVQASNGLYKAYADSKVGEIPVVFGAVGKDIALVDNKLFSTSTDAVDGVTPPFTIVKVEADTVSQNLAPDANGAKTETQIHTAACAEAGGPIQQNLSTVYTIGFAGGFPPPSSFGGKITIASLMNSSAWQPPPTATWFAAPSNSPVPPATPVQQPFRGSNADNPSVALAEGVYDWMRSLGLRLDRLGASAVLNQDLVAAANGGQTISYAAGSSLLELPAYADTATAGASQQSSCLMQDMSNQDDPRCITFRTGGTDGATSIANAFGYKPAEVECPASTAATVVDGLTGESKTTDGNSLSNICDFQNDVISTSHALNVVRNGMERALATAKLLLNHLPTKIDGTPDKEALIKWVEQNDGHATGRKGEAYLSWTIGSPNQQVILGYLKQPGLDVQSYLAGLRDNLPTNIHQLYIKRCAAKLVGIVRAFKVVSKDGLQELPPPAPPHTYMLAKKGKPVYYHLFPEVMVQGGQTIRGIDYHLFTDQQCEDAKNVLLDPHKQVILSGGYYQGKEVQWTDPKGTTGNAHTYGAITAKDDGSEGVAPTVACTGPYDPTDPADDEDGVDGNMPATANTNTRFIYNLQITGNAATKQGTVGLSVQNNGNPFGTNYLQPGQVHYVDCGALVIAQNGTTTSWSVIARDQAANLSAGDSFSQQPGSTNWCNGMLANGPCPVSAGEWRIGCPLPASPMCCKEGKKIGYAYENPFEQPQIPPVADDVCPPIPYTLY